MPTDPASLAEYQREFADWCDALAGAHSSDPGDRETVAGYRREIERLLAKERPARAA